MIQHVSLEISPDELERAIGFWKILGGTLVLLGLAVVRLPIAQMVRSRRRVGGVGT